MKASFKVTISTPDYLKSDMFYSDDMGTSYVNSDDSPNYFDIEEHPELVHKVFHDMKKAKAFAFFLGVTDDIQNFNILHALIGSTKGGKKYRFTVDIEVVDPDMPLKPFESLNLTEVVFHSYAYSSVGFWLNFYVNGKITYNKYTYS